MVPFLLEIDLTKSSNILDELLVSNTFLNNSITSFSDPSVGFSLQFKKDFLAENINKEKKISPNKSNEDKKKKFNAEIFSLDAFRSKKED